MRYLVLVKSVNQVRDCTGDAGAYFSAIRQRTGMGPLQAGAKLKKGRIVTPDAEFWAESPTPDAVFLAGVKKRRGGRPPVVLPGGVFSPYRPASEETKQKQRASMLARTGVKKTTWEPCAKCGEPNGKITKPAVTPDRFRGERFGINGTVCRHCYGTLYDHWKAKQ